MTMEKGTASQKYTLSWESLSYTVKARKVEKQILSAVSGKASPGDLVAIMGPSGSGKTTLLDVLADRVSSGRLEGAVKVNGQPRDKTFRKIASYVAQEDSLMGAFTVAETLRFAAALSLAPSVSRQEMMQRIEEVVEQMGLRSCAGTKVGDIFLKGLSGGQKRRLSIAIELLSRPPILLLDECTSGLDSASTHNVMEHIQKLAKLNHTVLLTIHQPSSAVFDMFTHLMLLAGGRTVYFGGAKGAIEYFKMRGHPCPTYTNPAEHFLALINTDFKGHADVEALVSVYQESGDHSQLMADLQSDLAGPWAESAGGSPVDTRTANVCTQFMVVTWRNSLNNVRNPGVYWVRVFMYVGLSLMVGTMYLSSNDDITAFQRVPLLFYVQAFLVFMSVAVLPFFLDQKAVFLRERANGLLDCLPYVLANFISALPGIFFIALVSTALVVPLAGLNGFAMFLLNLFLSLMVAESLMHVIGAAAPHWIIGITLGAGLFGMFMLCEGFMVVQDAIPAYWIWGYYLAFHTYSFEWFMYNEFKDEGAVGTAILEQYQIRDVDVPRNIGILLGYAGVLEVIFYIILKIFHTGRR